MRDYPCNETPIVHRDHVEDFSGYEYEDSDGLWFFIMDDFGNAILLNNAEEDQFLRFEHDNFYIRTR